MTETLWAPPPTDHHNQDLRRVRFGGADLRCADLSWADAREADFTGANLAGADLSDISAEGASFNGCDLRGAVLDGSNLAGSDLRGADLTGASLHGWPCLAGAAHDEATRWPVGFRVDGWDLQLLSEAEAA